MGQSRFRRTMSLVVQNIEPYDRLGFIDRIRMHRLKTRPIKENECLESAPPIILQWPPSIPKPSVGLVKSEIGNNAYWPKFERFLKSNDIYYKVININKSNFIEECKEMDIIVWRTPSSYVDQWEAADKVDYIQEQLCKRILPSRQALWMYEDKIRLQWLLEMNNLPTIKSFISYSREETENYINECQYPFISKDKTCSGSEGVHLINNKKQAKRLIRKVFYNGLKLNNSYVKQKNYVLFQEFVPNKGFDLRIIMVGDSYFGYYRYPKNDDYRASGSGIVEKKELPLEVLKLARKVRECLPASYLLAVDFLQDTRDNKYYIIETSIFISIESCEQLMVEDKPGRYVEKNGEFIFESGRFWLQELMMEELMKDWIKDYSKGVNERK